MGFTFVLGGRKFLGLKLAFSRNNEGFRLTSSWLGVFLAVQGVVHEKC